MRRAPSPRPRPRAMGTDLGVPMTIERYRRSTRRYHAAVYATTLLLLATGWWLLAGRTHRAPVPRNFSSLPDPNTRAARTRTHARGPSVGSWPCRGAHGRDTSQRLRRVRDVQATPSTRTAPRCQEIFRRCQTPIRARRAHARTHEGHQLVPGLVVARTAATPVNDYDACGTFRQPHPDLGLNETIVRPWSKLNHTSDASPSPGFHQRVHVHSRDGYADDLCSPNQADASMFFVTTSMVRPSSSVGLNSTTSVPAYRIGVCPGPTK